MFALSVYAASGAYLRRPVLRLMVSVPVVLTPVGGMANPNNLDTLQFIAVYTMFWMVLWGAVPSARQPALAACRYITGGARSGARG